MADLTKQFDAIWGTTTPKQGTGTSRADEILNIAKQANDTKAQSEKKSVGGFIGNVGSSSLDLAKGIGESITHPVKTIESLGKVTAGGIQSIPGVKELYDAHATTKGKETLDSNRQAFNSIIDHFGKRYGGNNAQEVLKNIGDTAYKDPAGFALDLSLLIGGAGGTVTKAGEFAKIPELAKAGQTISKVGEIVDPLRATTKVLGKTAELGGKAIGKIGGEGLGVTTGAGYQSVKEAFTNHGPEFTKALRGETTTDQVVNTAKGSLDALKQARRDEYLSNLEKLNGEPLEQEARKYNSAEDFVKAQKPVYHGSPTPLKSFSNKKGGVFFTDEYADATGFAGNPDNVYEGFLNFKKPLVIDAKGAKWDELNTEYGSSTQEVISNANGKGYDGVIFNNIVDNVGDTADFGGQTTIQYAYKPKDSFMNESQLTDLWDKAKKGKGKELNVSPIKGELDNQLKKFNVTIGKDNQLDFSRSNIRFNKPAQQEIQTIVDEMKTYGTKAGDTNIMGVDSLKQSFQDLYSDSSQVRAFTQAMIDKTRKVANTVEGYEKMSTAYSEKSNLIKEITKGLSLGDKAAVDTTLRKLNSTLKQNNEFRADLVKELESFGKKDLKGEIAGTSLNSLAPKGLQKVGAQAVGVGGLFLHNPAVLLSLATTSPRIVGEFVRALGLTAKQLDKITFSLREAGAGEVADALAKSGYYATKSDQQE